MSRFLYAAVLLLVGACKTTDPAIPSLIDRQGIKLYYQTSVTVGSGVGPVRLTLTEVNDSRCPAGGQCVWAGEARVALEIAANDQVAQTLRLGLNPGPKLSTSLPDSVSILLQQRAYWVRLLAVAPYPSLGSSQGPKVATVQLRPQ